VTPDTVYAASDVSMSSVGPVVDATGVLFRLRLPTDHVKHVRLCQSLTRPRIGPAMQAVTTGDGERQLWQARLDRPDVDRIEYQFELEFADGRRELLLDPHNPRRAAGPFGAKSVVELPGYRAPRWLDSEPVPGRYMTVNLASDVLDATLNIGLWAAPHLDFEREAPLLVVHDGPEYDRYSALLRFVNAMITRGRMPPVRVVLLPPPDRNEHYAASPRYARALARELMPILDWLAPQPRARRDGRSWRIGVGASLGALAALHAHRRYPDLFGGLFLQSGSFFQRRTDRQESSFFRFDRIVSFVDSVCGAERATRPVPVGMTCGTVEENLANNRRVRDALALQGYDVSFAEHRDGHNWVAWRDSFDPHFADLIERALA
jgi:enterochelin esterase-like enzyme